MKGLQRHLKQLYKETRQPKPLADFEHFVEDRASLWEEPYEEPGSLLITEPSSKGTKPLSCLRRFHMEQPRVIKNGRSLEERQTALPVTDI